MTIRARLSPARSTRALTALALACASWGFVLLLVRIGQWAVQS
jgi:hypothetical protein